MFSKRPKEPAIENQRQSREGTYTAAAAAEAFLICCHCLIGDDTVCPFFVGKELSLETGKEADLNTFRLCDGSNRTGADLARPEKARI
jgi:hypothetical protein